MKKKTNLIDNIGKYQINFEENNKFFKWIEENKELIKNVKVSVNNKNIRVIYDKM